MKFKYANPINVCYQDGTSYKDAIADPTLIFTDNTFYVFSTGRKVFKSTDGFNFKLITENIIEPPLWWNEIYSEDYKYGVWAPDVCKVKDKWIYYYSLSGWGKCCGIGYAIADNIEGPYKDMGKLFTYQEIGILNAIDSQVFYDNERLYMVLGSFQGLYILELLEDGMSLKEGLEYQKNNKVLIAGRVGSWDGSTYEGSYIIKKGEYYYYFGSVGTCCEGVNSTYKVYCARSKNLLGPYLDSKGNDILKSGNGVTYGDLVLWADKDVLGLAGPGHNSIIVDDEGSYWICYHCYYKDDNYKLRHLFIDKLSWDENGFPFVSHDNGKCIPSYKIQLDGPKYNINLEENL